MPSQEATRVSVLARLLDPTDEAAWEKARREFVERYTPWIWNWLKRQGLQPADAEDVSQEALMKALMEIKGFEHNGRIGAFRKWLGWIVRNRLKDWMREKLKQPALVGRELATIADGEASRVFERDLLRELLREHFALLQGFDSATLKEAERVLFNGEKIQAVAQEMGKKPGAVRTNVCRVKAGLRKSLEMSGAYAHHA